MQPIAPQIFTLLNSQLMHSELPLTHFKIVALSNKLLQDEFPDVA